MALCFLFQAEDGIRDIGVTGVQTCALPIFLRNAPSLSKIIRKRPTYSFLYTYLTVFYYTDEHETINSLDGTAAPMAKQHGSLASGGAEKRPQPTYPARQGRP